MRLAGLLTLLAGLLTSVGAGWYSLGAGLIVGGCWLAAWAALFVLEVGVAHEADRTVQQQRR